MKDIYNKYSLFIFDWDGTIVKIKLLNKLNELKNPFWKRKKLHKTEKLNNAQLHKIEIKEQSREERFRYILDPLVFVLRPKLQNDSLALLNALSKKRLALFTNGAKWRVKREMHSLRVDGFFKIFISAQDIGALKPSPNGIKLILKSENIPKDRALYVGDMADDIITAKAAGVDSCAIASGFDSYETLAAERPTYLFKDIESFVLALHSSKLSGNSPK